MRKTLLFMIFNLIPFTVPLSAAPLYPNSVVSNDLEFIKTNDASVFSCIEYLGTKTQEMPDKRGGGLMANGTYTFVAQYKDGTSVQFWAHPNFGSKSTAMKFVDHAARAVGKLPTFMRKTLDHVVIHKGDETAFAEDKGHFFVLYSDNMRTRIRNHDLEETVFHESVHATLDDDYANSSKWKRAAQNDGDYITEYSKRNPFGEDMAESALFAWAILMHDGRLPKAVEAKTREIMPNRLAYFESLFNANLTFYRVRAEQGC